EGSQRAARATGARKEKVAAVDRRRLRGRRLARPQFSPGLGVEPADPLGVIDQLGFVLNADQGWSGHRVPQYLLLLPLDLAGLFVEGPQPLVMDAWDNDRAVVKHGAAAHGNVVVLAQARQLFSPADLAVKVQRAENARAEEREDKFAIGRGRRHRVAVVLALGDDLACRNDGIPKLLAVTDPEA